jgi:monofunctional biosynthetic peptidoglycan transglycosylase
MLNEIETKNEKKAKLSKKKILLISLVGVILIFLTFTCTFFISLPKVSHLAKENPTTTAIIEQRKREAKQKGKKLIIQQKWVKFEFIPKILKDTVRVSEDAGFYQHTGIDFFELKEAIKKNWQKGAKARGGSTITQQLAKNLFLSTKKSYYRKIKEFFIAKKLEKSLTKNRIFTIYLNIIELGKGIYGVEAASEFYFQKSVDKLNLIEIVRLVSVLPKPLRVTPLSNSRYLKWRANLLLDRLIKYDYISQAEYDQAKIQFLD